MKPTRLILLTSALLAITATAASARTLQLVASFTVLADVVQQVGGDHVHVISLIGPNGNPHQFEPSSRASPPVTGLPAFSASRAPERMPSMA